MRKATMDNLQAMRTAAGFSFDIKRGSGYRDPSHPVEARKNTPGAHTLGKAVDIPVNHDQGIWILENARKYGFNRIGVSQRGLNRFIHIDCATKNDGYLVPALWSY